MASSNDIQVQVIQDEEDIKKGFDIAAATFGKQTRDGVWLVMNPGWDTPEGRSGGAARMVDRLRAATTNKDGNPNTVMLKATTADGTIAGFAIWLQASVVDGFGDAPVEDLSSVMELDALYPGDEAEKRYLCQCDRSLHEHRIKAVKEKAKDDPPAFMVLDMCVVDPDFQRRGIAKKLVQWGIDEARRRGGLECITEASTMGRGVYEKMGFQPQGEIEYKVDEQFADRDRPPNTFMRRPADKN